MENKVKVLAIIPAYNEEESICNIVRQFKKNCPYFDYIVINDGSRDNTARICIENKYNLIDLPLNLGLAGAFQVGMKYAYRNGYDYVIQIDADGQHLPEYIEKMYECAQEGYDIVIGSRFIEEKKPLTMRMLGSRLISFAIKITTGKMIKDPTSGMRMYSRKVMEEFANSINYGPEPDTVSFLIKNGANVKEVQVEMAERVAGESYLTAVKSIAYMSRMMVSIIIIQNFRER